MVKEFNFKLAMNENGNWRCRLEDVTLKEVRNCEFDDLQSALLFLQIFCLEGSAMIGESGIDLFI